MAATAGCLTEPAEPMRVLEKLLKASWNPQLLTAKPIVFDMILEKWTLDPSSTRGLIKQGAANDATLTVHTSPETLLRALTDPHFDVGDFDIVTSGDVTALTPLINALQAKQSALAVRMGKGF